MYIKKGSEYKLVHPLTPFALEVEPFTDTDINGDPIVIGPGRSLPDLARRTYGSVRIDPIRARFPFLDRDNKDRDYNPGREDKFVFKDWGSVRRFLDSAHKYQEYYVALWKSFGLSTTNDKYRKWEVIDHDKSWDQIDAMNESERARLYEAICYIACNEDIVKKTCIIRLITPGWWTANYRGRYSNDPSYFELSLRAHAGVFRRLMKSTGFRKSVAGLWSDAGDPLYTNAGYPFYEGMADADGTPVTKEKTTELFTGLVAAGGFDFKKLLKEVDRRGGKFGLPGHPFAVMPIRRGMAGSKTTSWFDVTPSGMRTNATVRGFNTIRLAFAVAYSYNLLLSPFQCLLKEFRKRLPGCYHDGESRLIRIERLRKQRAGRGLYQIESDYKNYDRSAPIDIIEKIFDFTTAEVKHGQYWKDMAMFLHKGVSLLWPDYHSDANGLGYAFAPDRLGIMSGVKITSELGTILNSVLAHAALAKSKGWNQGELESYLSMYVDDSVERGSVDEHIYITGDDVLLLGSTWGEVSSLAREFVAMGKKAGVTATLMVGDRFLMREMIHGKDMPVDMRSRQNFWSNETPPEDELTFLAGLVSRTDGMMGVKTVDPFKTGTLHEMYYYQLAVQQELFRDMIKSMETASFKSEVGIRFCQLMLDLHPSISLKEGLENPFKKSLPRGDVAVHVDRMRKGIAAKLAEEGLKQIKDPNKLSHSWLYELHRNAHSPSSQFVIDSLSRESDAIRKFFESLGSVEHAYFERSTGRLGVKLDSIIDV